MTWKPLSPPALRRLAPLSCLAGLATACVSPPEQAPAPPGQHSAAAAPAPVADSTAAAPPSIDARRSLAVTEQVILARFPLRRVLERLVAQSEVPGLTALGLFQQWWDTQNPGPGLGLGPHCDDQRDSDGNPSLNGFPYSCRPAPGEGAQAAVDPFTDPGQNPNEYVPIGLFNRFDLTPADGSHCGEYRIVYARRAGIANPRDRSLVIIEAALANPHPQQGLKGCRKIVDFWVDLGSVPSSARRADLLEDFYFDGLPSVAPVIHIEHLGAGPSGVGQLRTNQFMADGVPGQVWSLREFKLRRTCSGTSCPALQLVPVPVRNTLFGGLLGDDPHPQSVAFQAAFLNAVPDLAGATLADLDLDLAEPFTTGQSQASSAGENNYVVQFQSAPPDFRAAIADRLGALGSTLTPEDIVERAQFLSCAGCHRLSAGHALGGGVIAPSALGFVHVSERDTELVGADTRFRISDALVNDFLPARSQVVKDYLGDKLKPPRHPSDPIGGRRVH